MTDDDHRTDADLTLAAALVREDDPVTLAALMHAYYRDLDRAERTPRSTLYLHLGLVCGTLDRVARGTLSQTKSQT